MSGRIGVLLFPCLCLGAASVSLWAWPSVPAGATNIQVLPGQTLDQLAEAYGTTTTALAQVNGIADPNLIVAGTFLVLPGSTTSTAGSTSTGSSSTGGGGTAAGSTSTAGTADQSSVLVSPGDTLTSIAARYGTTVTALTEANGIADPNLIVVGTRLVVPVGTAPTPSAATDAGPAAVTTAATTPAATTGTSGIGTSGTSAGGLPAALTQNPTALALEPIFTYWAGQFGLPSSLLEAMCWWESGWQPAVTSVTGAEGIGQLEPATVTAMQAQLGTWNLSPWTAADNIEMAAAYLHDLMVDTSDTPSMALASYYQGLASVEKTGLLPSTEQYVAGIEAYTSDFS